MAYDEAPGTTSYKFLGEWSWKLIFIIPANQYPSTQDLSGVPKIWKILLS
jgi:hypothetical protein